MIRDPSENKLIRAQRNTARYRRQRSAFLCEFPFCALCLAAGRHVGATDLDHVVPAVGSLDLFWDQSNWQGLCRECHSDKTRAEAKARRSDPVLDSWDAHIARLMK